MKNSENKAICELEVKFERHINWILNSKRQSYLILRAFLDALKIPKLYKILHHTEYLNACMKY